MALSLDPTIRVLVQGSEITNYDNTDTFDLEDKLEISFDIQGTLVVGVPTESADYVIPLTVVRHTKMIFIHASNNINIKFTTAVGEFVIPSTGDFVLYTSQDFIDDLTSLHISTLVYAAPVSVYVNMYGKVPVVA
jgi:hypothetical protein